MKANNRKNTLTFSKILRGLSLVLFLSLTSQNTVSAQCPMCRMSLESNLKNGGSAGKGMNLGIFFLLSMPYLLVGGLTYAWWRNRKVKEDDELEDELSAI